MLASFPWPAADLSPFSLPLSATPETALPLTDALFQAFEPTNLNPDSAPPVGTDPWDTLLFEPLDPLPLSPPSSEGHRSESTTNSEWVPPNDKQVELVDIFFERVQWYFPLFHRQSLTASVKAGELRQSSPLLFYSVLSLAARFHPDPVIQGAQLNFHDKSRALYEATSHLPDRPLETLQAAACIVLQAFTFGDHSIAALSLSKAWRQTVALGFHHVDSPFRVVLPGITAPDASEWREKEQRRRILWTLFVLDKAMCFKAGLVHTIDDRQISAFLPMSEDVFQNSQTPPDLSDAILYPHNPKMLISTLQNVVRQKQPGNMMQFIILAHSLTARISDHMFSPVFGQDDPQHQLERAQLDQDLTQMRLILPRYATDLAAANHADFAHVIWLRLTMDVNTISLYHRPQTTPSATLDTQDATGLVEEDRWQHCVAAARNTVRLIREASRVSTDLLLNPYLAASLFTSARILAIEYILSSPAADGPNKDQEIQREALRADLDVMMLSFDRLSEALGGVLHKFRVGLLYQLRLDAAAVRAIKAGGTRGLLESCGKWPMARDIEGIEETR
ncbi:fungal-specific transcription factor domain-containing protein [Cercophora newfieldiana]|uniref:Fungal-specific transcription factor domain-containing protein n=1 Tax=Cercophora newfieldiana TaxID=92897 RepID=A0AA40CID1_9PEZI|nr:fungal-specific transcription factor domain-containing protein [Cercophora newfieldiana]